MNNLFSKQCFGLSNVESKQCQDQLEDIRILYSAHVRVSIQWKLLIQVFSTLNKCFAYFEYYIRKYINFIESNRPKKR